MQAQYDSMCPGCEEHIYAGETIFKDDDLGAWVCESCKPAAPSGLAGFGQQSRAGRTGVKPTLADKVKKQMAGSTPVRSTTLTQDDLKHIVLWLGWYIGEGNVPSRAELDTMRMLHSMVDAATDAHEQLSNHINETSEVHS